MAAAVVGVSYTYVHNGDSREEQNRNSLLQWSSDFLFLFPLPNWAQIYHHVFDITYSSISMYSSHNCTLPRSSFVRLPSLLIEVVEVLILISFSYALLKIFLTSNILHLSTSP
jgi:hypothetical protein